MYVNQQLGQYGENKACNYLETHNYKIIERNFRCRQGEIDIIAKDLSKNELVFVEVKTRLTFNFGRPSQAVTTIKQRHILNVAKYYLYKKSIKDTFIRFDVIEVFVKEFEFRINHIKQIF